MRRVFFPLPFLLLLLASPECLFAQMDAQFDFNPTADVLISMSPEHPSPGARVHLSAKSASVDLVRSSVAWYAGASVIAQGPGVTETDVTAGALGSATTVRVAVRAPDGTDVSASAVIRPTEVDLLWESDSYAPPFFRGRALPSAGTNLRVEALAHFVAPNGPRIPASDLIYTWRRNGDVIASVSGRGRSRAFLPGPPLFGADSITVDVASLDGSLSGEAGVRVPSVEPELVLYEDHPLFGILYNETLGARTFIPQSEMTFAAVPYFAQAVSGNDPRLSYAWRVNGKDISTESAHSNEITINAENSNGEALIGVALSHATNLFLSSSGSWGITFSSDRGSAAQDAFRAAR